MPEQRGSQRYNLEGTHASAWPKKDSGSGYKPKLRVAPSGSPDVSGSMDQRYLVMIFGRMSRSTAWIACCSQGSDADIGKNYMYIEKLDGVDIYV